jgi:hypothetical protein
MTTPTDPYLQGLESRGVLEEINAYYDAVDAGDETYLAGAVRVSDLLEENTEA